LRFARNFHFFNFPGYARIRNFTTLPGGPGGVGRATGQIFGGGGPHGGRGGAEATGC